MRRMSSTAGRSKSRKIRTDSRKSWKASNGGAEVKRKGTKVGLVLRS